MSVTVDANVLLYASDASSRFHERARALVEELARGPGIVYLFWPTIMAYLRIATHPAIFRVPLAPGEAMANVEALLTRPHVRAPGETDGFWARFREEAGDPPVQGNLVPDAHLVALMRENGVRTIWTHDRDFRRFDGIRVRDPFA
jgi:toxin-antitoxin system PIN domain toxin